MALDRMIHCGGGPLDNMLCYSLVTCVNDR